MSFLYPSASDTSSPCSPDATKDPSETSPTKTLIQKFNSLGQDTNGSARKISSPKPTTVIHVHSNPLDSPNSSGSEPMYATIGSKNRSQIASRFAK